MEDQTSRLEKSLQRYQGIVVFGLGFIVLFASTMMGLMVWLAFTSGSQANQIKEIAITTHSSLCTYRDDLEKRYDAANAFLQTHPQGLVTAQGDVLISFAVLQKDLDSRRAVISALDQGGLRCP